MSWLAGFFTPGDVRTAQQASTGDRNGADAAIPGPRIDAAHRRRRQDALLYGGLVFSLLSVFVTKRATHRRLVQDYPKYFTGSQTTIPKPEGAIEAASALGLATLNVFSFAMFTSGIAMTFFDVADAEDMREKVRKGMGFDVYGGDTNADQEIESWVADLLAKKDDIGGLKESVAQKLMELEKVEAGKREGSLEQDTSLPAKKP